MQLINILKYILNLLNFNYLEKYYCNGNFLNPLNKIIFVHILVVMKNLNPTKLHDHHLY